MFSNQNIELRIANVTSRGVVLEDRVYTHPLMIKHGWFEIAELQGEWQIPVLYNMSDPCQIVLFDTGSTELFVATSIEHSEADTTILDDYFKALNVMKTKFFSNGRGRKTN